MEDEIYIDGVAQTIIDRLTDEITIQLSNRLDKHFEKFILNAFDMYSEALQKKIKSETDQIKIKNEHDLQNQVTAQEQVMVQLKNLDSRLSGLEGLAKTILKDFFEKIDAYKSENKKQITKLKNATAKGEQFTSTLENEIGRLRTSISEVEAENIRSEKKIEKLNGCLISVEKQLETKINIINKIEKQKLVLEKKLDALQTLWEGLDKR